MRKICLRYALDMLKYDQAMPKKCQRYAIDIPTICPINVQYVSKICPRYAQDMAKVAYGDNSEVKIVWVNLLIDLFCFEY